VRDPCTLGVDIGTSSSKAVVVDRSGVVRAAAAIEHDVMRPRPGWAEMDADVWWREFCELAGRVLPGLDVDVAAVGVSGMGPCVLLEDGMGTPIRPAILYGIDSRASAQIHRLRREFGADEILRVGGSSLTSQSAGPKILWIEENEPDRYSRARRLFMPSSWLVFKLTGQYVLDHHAASQVSPFYDLAGEGWSDARWSRYLASLEPPRLRWAGDVAGEVTARAAAATGLRAGTPVITGTIDAWAEAASVGAVESGDLMMMYGTTQFLVGTTGGHTLDESLWTTAGLTPGSRSLAGGLATSGAVTAWLKEATGADFDVLTAEAKASGPGAGGLLTLPHFAGERTPVLDPDARGLVAGLTLRHTRGDLFRSALEGVALGVRHNLEAMRACGFTPSRTVAVGGGLSGGLWVQIVSDVTGLAQGIPRVAIGASYGGAFLAAQATADAHSEERPDITAWNPIQSEVRPTDGGLDIYDRLFALYLDLYASTKAVSHELAALQHEETTSP
jgi:xylulokinase